MATTLSVKRSNLHEGIIPGILWTLLLVLMVSMLSQFTSIYNALALGFKNLVIFLIIAYINSSWVIPKVFRLKKYLLYFLAILCLIVLAIFLNHLASELFLSNLEFNLPPKFPNPPAERRPGFYIIPIFFSSITILFVSTVYTLARIFNAKDRLELKLQGDKLLHELNFLRSQVNPHFIFNALNNIYATTSIAPHKTGMFILKLADMLRYVLEEKKEQRVHLQEEIEYIENYIFFQQERDQNFKNISFLIEREKLENNFIEPMLFIPLVENAFQHSRSNKSVHQFVHFRIKTSGSKILFTTKNNIGDDGSSQNKSTGLGLKNIKRRLEILYPNQHKFSIKRESEIFYSELIINNGTPS